MSPQDIPTPFTPVQQAVLDALAAGATKSAAAQSANIHRDTINDWEHHVEGFHDAVLACQAEYRVALSQQLRRISAKSLNVLEALLDNPGTPPSVLLRALQFALTRPSFPQKEWALPENLNAPGVQKMQESMAVIEADYIAMRQSDAVCKKGVGIVGLHAEHLPVSRHLPADLGSTPDRPLPESNECQPLKAPEDVGNVGFVGNASSVEDARPVRSVGNVGFTAPAPKRPSPHIARNAVCPCGSGKKYKRCCGSAAPPTLNNKKPLANRAKSA